MASEIQTTIALKTIQIFQVALNNTSYTKHADTDFKTRFKPSELDMSACQSEAYEIL